MENLSPRAGYYGKKRRLAVKWGGEGRSDVKGEMRVHSASWPLPQVHGGRGSQQRLYAGNISSFQVRSGTCVVIGCSLSLDLLKATSLLLHS